MRKPLPVLLTIAALLLVAACGEDTGGGGGAATAEPEPEATADAGAETDAETGTEAAAAEDSEPFTVDNCGFETTYTGPPERIVAVNQTVVEAVLALGAADRVVGTSYAGHGFTGISDELREEYEAIPVLSDRDVSKEVLYAAEPDFVVATFESSFAEEKGLSRDVLAADGIGSHVLYEDCIEGDVTWESLAEETLTLGRVLGVEEQAHELVEEQAGTVERVRDAVDGADPVRVFIYDSGESAPLTSAGSGIPNLMVTTAGGENVFGDLDQSWGEVSWEEVAARDPEVIIVNDYQESEHGSPTLEHKLEYLRELPAISSVEAIRQDRIAVVSLHDFFLGARNAEATAEIAAALHPDLAG